MDPSRFAPHPYGEVTRQPGDRWAFWYFAPRPMPRELPLSAETVLLLSRADAAVGRLSGVARLLPDSRVLVRPYLAREAVTSSRIEGTQASLSDVLQAEAEEAPARDDDVQEVRNYLSALGRGLELLPTVPIGIRLLRELHEVLLSGARGTEKRPGEFRTSPVWIGRPGGTLAEAEFVPPTADEVPEALADWERFVNDPPRLPLLIRCALMHYQFEAIHPFLDGNGRIGRLLIILMLVEEAALSTPFLHVSAYMEENRREYYERLQAVREQGEMQEWLCFFLRAVATQAEGAEARIQRLMELRERYRSVLRGSRSRVGEVAELLFSNPFVTVRRVQRELDVTNQGARNLIDSLEKRGWLRKLRHFGEGGRIFWVADEVLEIME